MNKRLKKKLAKRCGVKSYRKYFSLYWEDQIMLAFSQRIRYLSTQRAPQLGS
jgi:hypothetical protein